MRRARTPTELGFNQYDRRRLSHALQTATDARTYQRLLAVSLLAQGRTVRDVAQITRAQPWSIYAWLKRYLHTRRAESLDDAARPGRPRVAPRITVARIAREIRRDPLRLGYNTTGWTVALLAKHLAQKFQCPLSARTLRRRMRLLGLRWKRPRYVYHGKDPNRAQKKGASFAA
jgi:transposase